MATVLLWVIVFLVLLNAALVLALLLRSPRRSSDEAERAIREELRAGRAESARTGR